MTPMSWIAIGIVAFIFVVGVGGIILNVRMSKKYGKQKEQARALREGAERTRRAQSVRKRPRRRGRALMDSLQNRGD